MYSIRTQVSTCLGWEHLADDTWSGMKKRKAPSKALNGEADCIQPAPCMANRQEVVCRVCFPPLFNIYQQSPNSHPFTQLYPRFLCKSKDTDHNFFFLLFLNLFSPASSVQKHLKTFTVSRGSGHLLTSIRHLRKKPSVSTCLATVSCLDLGTCQMDYFLLCKN